MALSDRGVLSLPAAQDQKISATVLLASNACKEKIGGHCSLHTFIGDVGIDNQLEAAYSSVQGE